MFLFSCFRWQFWCLIQYMKPEYETNMEICNFFQWTHKFLNRWIIGFFCFLFTLTDYIWCWRGIFQTFLFTPTEHLILLNALGKVLLRNSVSQIMMQKEWTLQFEVICIFCFLFDDWEVISLVWEQFSCRQISIAWELSCRVESQGCLLMSCKVWE